jgi:hypothetical protein
MEHVALEEPDADRARACAQFFLNWHDAKYGTSYELKKATEVFPDLIGQKGQSDKNNWDFVAEQKERPRWMAIEVKGLRFRPLLQDVSQWKSFCSHIENEVSSKVPGRFVLFNVPLPPGHASQRKKAAKEIARLVVDKAQSLTVGESIETQGEKPIRICKLSDGGSSVYPVGKLPWYPSDRIEGEETDRVLGKAIKQLAVALSKGASRCILLLCWDAPRYDTGTLRDSIKRRQAVEMNLVDEAFLVHVQENFVCRLWARKPLRGSS